MISELPPFFTMTDQGLRCESVLLRDLAAEYGTPLYVYSQASILNALAAYQKGLSKVDHLICYAMKANSNLSILRLLAQQGCGFDIVSGGELARALAVGVAPEKIIFSGVGKTETEIKQALAIGIGCFNVESHAELHRLAALAQQMDRIAPVSLRVNPNVDAQTHPYISTGLNRNKFGIAQTEALAVYEEAVRHSHLRVIGIDCHIGSQITTIAPYLEAVDKLLDMVHDLETSTGIRLEHLDFGGGLGVCYDQETPPSAHTLWQTLLERIQQRGYADRKIVIEPGRSLVANAGVCLTQVQYLKPASGAEGSKNFVIVDAAMNDLPRPAMYQAYHGIVPIAPSTGTASVLWDVVGPVCESGDWLARERALNVQAGDVLAVLSSGAYCMSMASHYNTRPRGAEVLVHDKTATLIRPRETIESLFQNEQLCL